jgi:hypothetical protein
MPGAARAVKEHWQCGKRFGRRLAPRIGRIGRAGLAESAPTSTGRQLKRALRASARLFGRRFSRCRLRLFALARSSSRAAPLAGRGSSVSPASYSHRQRTRRNVTERVWRRARRERSAHSRAECVDRAPLREAVYFLPGRSVLPAHCRLSAEQRWFLGAGSTSSCGRCRRACRLRNRWRRRLPRAARARVARPRVASGSAPLLPSARFAPRAYPPLGALLSASAVKRHLRSPVSVSTAASARQES